VSGGGDGVNPMLAVWHDGRPTIGCLCELPTAMTAEIVAQAGFDWVCVDWQHGAMDAESVAAVVHMLSTHGTAPVVRVPANEAWLIQKALDAGAYGVIIPMVDSRDDAQRAIAACRFAPEGGRSFGPFRAASVVSSEPELVNRRVFCIVMVETAAGLEAIDEIATTPGLDGIFIGPWDLTLSMGLPLGSEHAIQVELDRILAAGRRHGVPVGLACASPEMARAALTDGFAFVTAGTDREFLAASAVATARAARGAERVPTAPLEQMICRMVLHSNDA
jgi:4-hydroxy-2-oxoheptanedioate aldolase